MSQKAACLVFVIGLTCLLFAQASGSEGKLNIRILNQTFFFNYNSLANMNMFYGNFTKGQLISKANSKLFIWTKNQRKYFYISAQASKSGQIKKI